MHDDDRPVGRTLSRREALGLFGASAAAFAPGALANVSAADPLLVTADCVAQPEQTEGPYFVDTALERSDIRLEPATGTVSATRIAAAARRFRRVGTARLRAASSMASMRPSNSRGRVIVTAAAGAAC